MKTKPIIGPTLDQIDSARSRSIKTVIALLGARQLDPAVEKTRAYFRKYGCSLDRNDIARFYYPIKSHEHRPVSQWAWRIEQAAFVGAIEWCQTRRFGLILKEHKALGEDLLLRLGELLPRPKFENKEIVDAGFGDQPGMRVHSILNKNRPIRIFDEGYLYCLRDPEGKLSQVYERELLPPIISPTAIAVDHAALHRIENCNNEGVVR